MLISLQVDKIRELYPENHLKRPILRGKIIIKSKTVEIKSKMSLMLFS